MGDELMDVLDRIDVDDDVRAADKPVRSYSSLRTKARDISTSASSSPVGAEELLALCLQVGFSGVENSNDRHLRTLGLGRTIQTIVAPCRLDAPLSA
jgi:hypothetical protein